MEEKRFEMIPKAEMLAQAHKQYSPSIFDEVFFEHYVLPQIKEQTKELNDAVDYACRNLVTPPIKGEITKGKVKWRGLRLVYVSPDLKMEQDGDKMNFTYEQGWELWQRDKKIF